MTEKEFHVARRMFLAKDGTVLVAPAAYPYTHSEWLSSLFGYDMATQLIHQHTRGYVLGNRLVAYKSDNFSHWVSHLDVVAALDVFDRMYPGTITEVGIGAKPRGSQPWEPQVVRDAATYYEQVLGQSKRKDKIDGKDPTPEAHNEWFGQVSRGGRKSCPSCYKKLDHDEQIWSWGEYLRGKFRNIKDVCKHCWPQLRKRLTDHTAGCGCTVTLCGRGGTVLPDWMTLEAPVCALP